MSEKILKGRSVQKHDTEANWLKATNFIPKQGEIIIYDIDSTHTNERMKIGDGKTVVSSLPFIEANKASEANHAISANSATNATQDASGNVITTTYETKIDATSKLNTAKGYTDEKISAITPASIGAATAKSVSDLDAKIGEDSVAAQINSAISGKANTSDLTSHTGNTTVHITPEERTKWNTHTNSDHAPSNAQANVIESISVNGTKQTITNKAVNITVPTDNKDLANGAGYLVASDIENKADKATTLAGYGITDAATSTHTHDYAASDHTHTIDSALSESSTNPVQNKIVNAAINALEGKVGEDTVANQISDAIGEIKYAGSSSAGGSATSAVKLDTSTAGSATQPVYFTEGKPSACTYSLNKTVPSDAKFTDTTYSAATTSAAGLMSAVDKTKSDATNIAYGTCSTAAATAAKVVAISGNTNWKLAAGSTITVLFSNTNTAENPTLNVNNTGAKNIFYASSQITTSSLGYAGTESRPMTFMYDGTQYRFIGWGYDSNTTYTNVKLGHGYATCSTAAATTAKVASLSSYTLTTGGIVAVRFTYDVPAGATLNINSKGAKAIYHKNAAITAGVIKAGDTATFIYSTYYRLVSIDRWGSDLESIKTSVDTISDLVGDTEVATQISNAVGAITPESIGAATSGHTHSSYANQNAFSNVTVGSTTIAADTTTDTLTLVAGSNVTITPDATNDKITIAATDTTYSDMKGATSSAAGTHGLVPAPAKGKQASFLRGDGTWVVPTNTVTTATTSGSGNAVTAVTASNGALTVTKGETFATKAQLDTVSGLVGDTAVATQIENAVSAITPASIGAATTSHASSSGSKIGTGTADVYGHVKLSNSVQSTYGTGSGYAATPSAVKEAYDLAFGKADSSHTHTVSNITDLTATATELNYMDGVTSNVQTQLDYCLENINYNSEQISLNADNILSAIEVAKTYSDERLDEEVTAIETVLNGKANTSHGNHVPAVQTASNKVFLRNDNTWQTITPANIGAAASSHTHSYLPLSGGTLTGNLTIGSAEIHSSSGQTVGLKVNRMWHFGDNAEVTVINKVSSTHALCPSDSGTKYLGSSSYLWKQLYASTTTINKSDRNQKRDISDLDDKYVQLFDLVRPTSYYLINGDRVHTGFIAQEVEDAMTQVGLTAEELGFFCRDIKTEPVYNEDGERIEDKEVYDEDGNPVYVYGLRYSEYIAIMAAKVKKLEDKYNSKLEELEKRLEALEA